ncbi:MAG: hypothetical protein KAW92_09675 [Candidatus Cloacimonetes bacterium]|nr:hypothetical protein [Candidatus Cloacimonadota bacterium]
MKIPILSNWIEKQVEKRLQSRGILLEKFFKEARDAILGNDMLMDAMAKQRVLLLKHNRKPIAIFVSKEVFEDVLSKVVAPSCAQKRIREGKSPLTDVAKVPVYVSSLLEDAALFVVGSITWKSEVNNDSHE